MFIDGYCDDVALIGNIVAVRQSPKKFVYQIEKSKKPASSGSCHNLRKIKLHSAHSLVHDARLGMSWSLTKLD